MSVREIHAQPRGGLSDWPGQDDEHVYALVEEARLRCEQLTALASTESARCSAREIHHELGLAGWLAGWVRA
jgi:hypothetical protein